MRKAKKILLIFALLIAAVAVYLGLKAYTVKVPHASAQQVEIAISATDLFNAFALDEVKAGRKFNDKVIEVVGSVREVVPRQEGRMNIVLETGDPMGAVVCEFTEPAEVPAVGSTVAIKGFCAGFNLDVLLQRCAFTRPNLDKGS